VLNFINRFSELHARDTELIADVIVKLLGYSTIPQIYSKAVNSTPCLGSWY
jgi:hypothetical protein